MSAEIAQLRSSIANLRQRIFGYEGALKAKIISLYKEAYHTRLSGQAIWNEEVAECAQQGSHDEIRDELRVMWAQVDELNANVEDLEVRLEEKKEEHYKHCTRIRDLKTTTTTLEEQVNTLNREAARRATVISTLRGEVSSKDLLLLECQSERDRLKNQTAFPTSNLGEIDTLKKRLQSKQDSIEALNERLSDKNKLIADHQSEKAELKEHLQTMKIEYARVLNRNRELEHASEKPYTANPGTEKLQKQLMQFIQIRMKDQEEASAVQVLVKAMARQHKQLDEKDAALAVVPQKLADLRRATLKAKNEVSSGMEFQKLAAIAAGQALQIQELKAPIRQQHTLKIRCLQH